MAAPSDRDRHPGPCGRRNRRGDSLPYSRQLPLGMTGTAEPAPAGDGFALLNYTALGFHRSCGKDPGCTYLTDPTCQGKASWTHLADRRWEIHDTQVPERAAGGRAHRRSGAGGRHRRLLRGSKAGCSRSARTRSCGLMGQLMSWRSPDGVPIRLAQRCSQSVPHRGIAWLTHWRGRGEPLALSANSRCPPPGRSAWLVVGGRHDVYLIVSGNFRPSSCSMRVRAGDGTACGATGLRAVSPTTRPAPPGPGLLRAWRP